MNEMIYNSVVELEKKTKECIGKRIYDYDIHGKLKNKKNKGAFGQIMEEGFYGIANNTRQEPDFKNIGVELKVSPYKWINNGKTVSAKERLVITDINYNKNFNEKFVESHCYKKIKRIQMLFYEHHSDAHECIISKTFFYEYDKISDIDKAIIQNDYNKIIRKINEGKAHEISEGDTDYLGACTKGSNALKSKVSQPFSDKLAPSRAFTFKTGYMTQLLRNDIFYKYENRECLIKDINILKNKSIAEIAKSYLDNYKGKTIKPSDVITDFDIIHKKIDYSFLNRFISRMLKTNLNNPDYIDEFMKSGIKVMAVRIMKNGKNKESVSLPSFKVCDLISEDWEESTLRDMFLNTKFLVCVFDEINDKKKEYCFRNSFFWTMDEDTLDSKIKSVWEDTKQLFIEGITLKRVKRGSTYIIKNNLPKLSDKRIIHVRPHTSASTYKFDNIVIHENLLHSCGDTLPDGRVITRQCFFINKDYILNIVNKNSSN